MLEQIPKPIQNMERDNMDAEILAAMRLRIRGDLVNHSTDHLKCTECGVGIDHGKETYFISPVEVRVLCPVCHDEKAK